jgi:hypothetical protein
MLPASASADEEPDHVPSYKDMEAAVSAARQSFDILFCFPDGDILSRDS